MYMPWEGHIGEHHDLSQDGMATILRGVGGECDNMQCIQEFLDMMPAGQCILILSTYLIWREGQCFASQEGCFLRELSFVVKLHNKVCCQMAPIERHMPGRWMPSIID
jgi:hypothetical protein